MGKKKKLSTPHPARQFLGGGVGGRSPFPQHLLKGTLPEALPTCELFTHLSFCSLTSCDCLPVHLLGSHSRPPAETHVVSTQISLCIEQSHETPHSWSILGGRRTVKPSGVGRAGGGQTQEHPTPSSGSHLAHLLGAQMFPLADCTLGAGVWWGKPDVEEASQVS